MWNSTSAGHRRGRTRHGGFRTVPGRAVAALSRRGHPDVLVYRPAENPFPREEGRDGFEIQAGGEFYYLAVGRGDGTEVSNGRWTIEAPDRVRIDVDNKRVKPFWLEVISCDAETLKVKR
jgi:hypothetical protein